MTADSIPLILVCDDDGAISMLLEELCHDAGWRTISAANGREAVETALRESPDLVVMDGNMPEMDGFAATAELKANPLSKHMPIVMLTGMRSREDRIRGIAAGANDFLTKPVDGEELVLRVSNNLKIKEYHDFLANHAAILEREVAERTEEIRDALERLTVANELVTRGYIDTIFRLAVLSEFKDKGTGSHIRRIGHFAKELSSSLGMPSDFTDAIYHASMMHDIGKVGIPDSIMLKTGALDEAEWKIMKSHAATGARILSGSESPHLIMAEGIAMSHHERWDGNGYPEGLSGEAIPIAARITTIVDQYDALRTLRSYKPPRSHEEAMEIIVSGDGRTAPGHFDPRVLGTFAAKASRFAEIYAEQSADGEP
jgi:putative two-component system response regulator